MGRKRKKVTEREKERLVLLKTKMIRTNIYITPYQEHALKLLKIRTGEDMASQIRGCIKRHIIRAMKLGHLSREDLIL